MSEAQVELHMGYKSRVFLYFGGLLILTSITYMATSLMGFHLNFLECVGLGSILFGIIPMAPMSDNNVK